MNVDSLAKAIIGFDRMFDEIEHRITSNYPPYNIVKVDNDNYEIQVAVTGLSQSEIVIKVDGNKLMVSAEPKADSGDVSPQYIYKGLSTRSFTKTFTLEQYVEVKSAVVKNGLLSIKLQRVLPETMKSRVINITTE